MIKTGNFLSKIYRINLNKKLFKSHILSFKGIYERFTGVAF